MSRDLSIIIPVYNSENIIEECLKNIINEAKSFNYEIIVVDDCSKDKTTDVVNSQLLKKLNLINRNSVKLKILGSGQIKDKINIEADLASKSAVEKLEKIGGSINIKK